LSYQVSVRVSAKYDLAEAEEWYEKRESGLGLLFREEVHDAIVRISENPFLYPERFDGNRRHVLKRFPDNIWYRVIGSEVLVMAVIHGKRGTRHLRGRLTRP
jgi:toxin ParE1/3/4